MLRYFWLAQNYFSRAEMANFLDVSYWLESPLMPMRGWWMAMDL
jgi:hypothetical protein